MSVNVPEKKAHKIAADDFLTSLREMIVYANKIEDFTLMALLENFMDDAGVFIKTRDELMIYDTLKEIIRNGR